MPDSKRIRWGVVATVKASAREILEFAAYHLEAGASRIIIFFDAPQPVAQDALRRHPKARSILCDADNWRSRGGRPEKHQVRQIRNATRAYAKHADLDWLAHIDVDEFLISNKPLARILQRIPKDVHAVRIHPIEVLAGGDGTAFKAPPPIFGSDAQSVLRKVYPEFGDALTKGFLSHTAGKLLVRSGFSHLRFRIHKAVNERDQDVPAVSLPTISLAHLHARDYVTWRAHFVYRHTKGSYREDLAPNRSTDKGGRTLHEVFADLLDRDGEEGLRRFYREVVADGPDLRERLRIHDMLRTHDLDLDAALKRHFPEAVAKGI